MPDSAEYCYYFPFSLFLSVGGASLVCFYLFRGGANIYHLMTRYLSTKERPAGGETEEKGGLFLSHSANSLVSQAPPRVPFTEADFILAQRLQISFSTPYIHKRRKRRGEGGEEGRLTKKFFLITFLFSGVFFQCSSCSSASVVS